MLSSRAYVCQLFHIYVVSITNLFTFMYFCLKADNVVKFSRYFGKRDSKLARFAFSKYELRKCSHYSDHATFTIKYNSTNPKHKYIQDFQNDLKHNYLRLRRSVSYYYVVVHIGRGGVSLSVSINIHWMKKIWQCQVITSSVNFNMYAFM